MNESITSATLVGMVCVHIGFIFLSVAVIILCGPVSAQMASTLPDNAS